MKKLEVKLKEWVSRQIISQEQAELIRRHEESKPENSWILSGLLILGVLIIGIGLISIIAANWDQIPDVVKLSTNFILLITLAFITFKSWESEKSIRLEVLLFAFMIHILATIGLISQVFHTGGNLYQALLLWSLISFGVMLASRGLIVPLMWAGAFLFGIIYSAMVATELEPIFHKNFLAILMTTTYLCAFLAVLSRNIAGEMGITKAFRICTTLIGFSGLIGAENFHTFSNSIHEKLYPLIPGYLLAAITAGEIIRSVEYRKLQKIILISIMIIFFIQFHLPFFEVTNSIVSAFLTILLLTLMSIFLASLQERRLFQWVLSVIGLRFLVLYFQALGGLATTGIGLIVSGGFVILLAVLWNKYKTSIADWAEGVSK